VKFDARWPLELSSWPGLEAQVAALSDDIAYVNHDIDDGLRANLFGLNDLVDAPLVGAQVAETRLRYPDLELSRLIGEIVRQLIGILINDMIAETRRRIAGASLSSVTDVRGHGQALAAFSAPISRDIAALKSFLFAHMYRHPRVMASMDAAQGVVTQLFEAFSGDPALLPPDWAALCGKPGDSQTAATVRDYIAGMTDRFALQEHKRIFLREISL
jgi:dGTPase